VKNEVCAKTVELDSLLEGKAAAFVHAHSTAMLSFVTDDTTVKADICPETLLFDVYRLGELQREFQNIVTSVTMILTASHSIAATKNPMDTPVLAKISDILTPHKKEIDLEATVDAIKVELIQSSLSEANQNTLLQALLQCASPTDAVHCLM
jgi:hypothetical protein